MARAMRRTRLIADARVSFFDAGRYRLSPAKAATSASSAYCRHDAAAKMGCRYYAMMPALLGK